MNINPTYLTQELERMKQENARRKEKEERKIFLKVTPTGTISLYGLKRFPVTLNKTAWLKLFTVMDQVKEFINKNETKE